LHKSCSGINIYALSDHREYTLHKQLRNASVNLKWFVRKGIFFFPSSVIGWLIAIAAVGYCVYVFIDIDNRSHSVSDTLINFVFNALLVAVVYSVIAFFTSKENMPQ